MADDHEPADEVRASTQYDVEHLATFSTSTGATTSASHETAPPLSQAPPDELATGEATGELLATNLNKLNNRQQASVAGPRVALERLFELEKQSGIWTQRMQIELRADLMLIRDCETNATVERFARARVTRPEAFSQHNDIYNNIIVFTISHQQQQQQQQQHQQPTSNEGPLSKAAACDSNQSSAYEAGSQCDRATSAFETGELHIFQCVSHQAQELVADILAWKAGVCQPQVSVQEEDQMNVMGSPGTGQESGRATVGASNKPVDEAKAKQTAPPPPPPPPPAVVTVASSAATGESVPLVNVNVKETVQVFNQIAALREKGSSSSGSGGGTGAGQSGGNNNQTPSTTSAASRPLSSDVSLSLSGGGEGAARPTAALSPGGQLYKQRSIRATLAPKHVDEQQQQPTESKAGVSSSSVSGGSSSSASSRSDQNRPVPSQREATKPDSARLSPQQRVRSAQNGHSSGRTKANGSRHSATRSHQTQQLQQARSSSDSSQRSRGSPSSQQSFSQQLEQVTTNESYVSVLNHCFDDIEKFIIRLQHAHAAARELQAKRRGPTKKSVASNSTNGHYHKSQNGFQPVPLTTAEMALLNSRAHGPNADDFFEILSKFKLAFNLLAKLKGCIHEPNAPELVHFLFTPLAIIIESARNVSPPVDPTLVGIPYLNRDALELLSNCCTSKESDLWLSLGPNWTQTIEPTLLKAARLPSSFQPIFSDGWAPVISELELIGLNVASAGQTQPAELEQYRSARTICAPPDLEELSSSQQQLQSAGRVNKLALSSHGSEPSLKSAGARHHHNHHQQKRRGSPGPQQPAGSQFGALDAVHKSPYDSANYLRTELAPDERHRTGQRSARHSMPKGERSASEYAANYLPQTARYLAGGQPLEPMPAVGHLSSSSSTAVAGYALPGHHHRHHLQPMTDDYTELQGERGGLAGQWARRRLPLVSQRERYLESHGYADHHPHHQLALDEPAPLPPPPLHVGYHGKQEEFYDGQREAMLLDLGPSQTEWFYELTARGALVVRVLFTREANNDKELTVKRGELLEVLDDSRKWWKARNIDLQVAYVPHTIVAIMDHYQTLDELLANSPGELLLSPSGEPMPASAQRRREPFHQQPIGGNYDQHYRSSYNYNSSNFANLAKRNSNKTAARCAFRYF